jgi:hypothetical protein
MHINSSRFFVQAFEQIKTAHVLDKAARGWPLSPWMTRGNRKFPLTEL